MKELCKIFRAISDYRKNVTRMNKHEFAEFCANNPEETLVKKGFKRGKD